MKVQTIESHEQSVVSMEGASGARMRMLIGPADGARNFHMRHFEVEPGGSDRRPPLRPPLHVDEQPPRRLGIDLDPPVEMGPVDLAPNASLRIRILEVPAGKSHRWQVFVDGTNVRGGEGSLP